MSNPLKLAPGMDADGNAQREFDAATQETITRMAAVMLDEDFIGPGHSTIPLNGAPATGYAWVQRTVKTAGAPTVAIVPNAGGGLVALVLAATSEAEEADLYQNDMLNWDMTKYASFETRLSMAVLPASSAECVWGLRSAWVSGPDNFAQYLDFQILGSGAVNVRIKDGVNSPQSYATGATLSAGVFHNFRIDISDPTNVMFFIDGVRVSPTPGQSGYPMSFAATGAAAILQPYFSCYKATGTDVPAMQVDSVQLSMNRA